MAYRLSNGNVTDDVTWPWKVKFLTPIRLERNISKTDGDKRLRSKGPPIGNDIYGVSNGHVTDDVTWPPKVLWGSTVGYPSDSLASCSSFDITARAIGVHPRWPSFYCLERYLPQHITFRQCRHSAVASTHCTVPAWRLLELDTLNLTVSFLFTYIYLQSLTYCRKRNT